MQPSAVVPAIGKIVNLQADEALAQSQDGADIERIAAAIEADAGEPLPELRQALAEAQVRAGHVTMAEPMIDGRVGKPL